MSDDIAVTLREIAADGLTEQAAMASGAEGRGDAEMLRAAADLIEEQAATIAHQDEVIARLRAVPDVLGRRLPADDPKAQGWNQATWYMRDVMAAIPDLSPSPSRAESPRGDDADGNAAATVGEHAEAVES